MSIKTCRKKRSVEKNEVSINGWLNLSLASFRLCRSQKMVTSFNILLVYPNLASSYFWKFCTNLSNLFYRFDNSSHVYTVLSMCLIISNVSFTTKMYSAQFADKVGQDCRVDTYAQLKMGRGIQPQKAQTCCRALLFFRKFLVGLHYMHIRLH